MSSERRTEAIGETIGSTSRRVEEEEEEEEKEEREEEGGSASRGGRRWATDVLVAFSGSINKCPAKRPPRNLAPPQALTRALVRNHKHKLAAARSPLF